MRGRSRARTHARDKPVAAAPQVTQGPRPAARVSALRRGIQANLTARALALVVVLLVLTISYATSLRIYFAQAHDIAESKAEITTRQARIVELQGELSRWSNPTYVRTQARERLGWVVPGETAFTVVGADGKPLGGGLAIESETPGAEAPSDVWWSTMWGSVEAADKPAPVKPKTKDAPITTKTKTR